MDSYSIIIKPHVTEKTMNLIDKNNEITFVVKRDANKSQIKRAFEELYEEKVARVTTHITPRGNKVAFIKLVEEGCGHTYIENTARKAKKGETSYRRTSQRGFRTNGKDSIEKTTYYSR